MSDDYTFTPQRHEIFGSDPAPGLETLCEAVHAMTALEDEINLEVNRRRVMAASLFGLGWRATPHLAEHLAWLLERETDGLTAYSLYRAVLATHPEPWMLDVWTRDVMARTPFALLKTAMLGVLVDDGRIDFYSEEDKPLLGLLDHANPEHRAAVLEQKWLVNGDSEGGIGDVLAMLQPTASIAEKMSAIRIVDFVSKDQIGPGALRALTGLFRVEQHPGLSLKIADTLVRKNGQRIDLDMLAYLIRAEHEDDVPAAKFAIKRVLYGVEAHLLDHYGPPEQRPSDLSTALLKMFSRARTPDHGQDVAQALQELSIDMTQPLAAFAATAALKESNQNHEGGSRAAFACAQGGDDPVARALAIRVLGQQSKALLPLLDQLKTLAVAPNTDPRVRRSAFHALVNIRQSALPTTTKDIIDLYFRYLREAPFSHFADAVHGSDIAGEPQHFLMRFSESFDSIASEAAREAAMRLAEKPFGFGLREEFEPYWPEVVGLMLKALDQPTHDTLHYFMFWNMLHHVPMPKKAAEMFAHGLKQRLAQLAYAERITPMIEEWLAANQRA